MREMMGKGSEVYSEQSDLRELKIIPLPYLTWVS